MLKGIPWKLKGNLEAKPKDSIKFEKNSKGDRANSKGLCTRKSEGITLELKGALKGILERSKRILLETERIL